MNRAERLQSIDVMRGVVMVLMAVDHVRVYSAVPAGGPTPGIFLTRWITHFVAPAFAFLAGTGIFLHGRKLGDRGALARYLLARGAILLLLEFTFVRVMWTFNLDFAHYVIAGVMWMLGICMMLMAALIWLPAAAVGVIGLVIIFGQGLFGLIGGALPEAVGTFLYFGGNVGPIAVLYSIVPWIGVMAAGYGFGLIVIREPEERRRLCLAIGLSAVALFFILRGIDGYGDPRHWKAAAGPMAAAPAWIRFINTSKYPASPDFLLMTLGPMIALLPLAERARGPIANVLAVFGGVPLFYYLLHLPAIHLAALVISLIREGHVVGWLFANHPMSPPPAPPGYQWPLWLLYLVFAIVVTALYFPSRWYAEVKRRNRESWLRYI